MCTEGLNLSTFGKDEKKEYRVYEVFGDFNGLLQHVKVWNSYDKGNGQIWLSRRTGLVLGTGKGIQSLVYNEGDSLLVT